MVEPQHLQIIFHILILENQAVLTMGLSKSLIKSEIRVVVEIPRYFYGRFFDPTLTEATKPEIKKIKNKKK